MLTRGIAYADDVTFRIHLAGVASMVNRVPTLSYYLKILQIHTVRIRHHIFVYVAKPSQFLG